MRRIVDPRPDLLAGLARHLFLDRNREGVVERIPHFKFICLGSAQDGFNAFRGQILNRFTDGCGAENLFGNRIEHGDELTR